MADYDIRLVSAAAVTVLALYRLVKWSRQSGPVMLPGPPADTFLWGSLQTIRDPKDIVPQWTKKYGKTFAVTGFLSMKRLYTLDLRAIAHVLSHPAEFHKPWQSRIGLTAITGPGLVAVEGDVHKRQRKILNPVFSQAQIRGFTPLFVRKAQELKDLWKAEVISTGDGSQTIDVLGWLSRATLDIIGEAGFGYQFNALVDESNELSVAFNKIFDVVSSFNPLEFLQIWVPVVGKMPTKRNKEFEESTGVLRRVGMGLIEEKTREAAKATPEKQTDTPTSRDLLSVLIKSNADNSLSEEEVLAQIATFIAAGHETTSTAMTWALYALASSPEVQAKLRAELTAFPNDNPTMEELNGLQYLDWVVRESLRVYSPVEITSRQPIKDEVVPLSEPVTDLDGKVHTELHLRSGDVVFIHIREINMSPDIWGEDARIFRPERWESPPADANAVPSVYANLMTFLSGPRACIGWRMAIAEMKAFIFTMVRTFDIQIDPKLVIVGKLGRVVTRPVVVGEEAKGNQMPLKLTLLQQHKA
ncbi:hypothetical protein FRC04_001879 [Tulasnella sp. 424]|nr:hypothetical protein FRC04_001879 [Tulasnella sp. 424]KAG8977660.1 hypothetical protein FRC05_000916 [Tulasnella sp. 425]